MKKLRYHGLTGTPEFDVLRSAIARCGPNGHREYAGRGIRVCQEWLDDPRAFVSHVGLRPSPAHTLDRIDVNGHYEPGNVRWTTWAVQQRNKRNNVFLTANGKTQCIQDWATETGLARKTIEHRLHVLKLSPEQVVDTQRQAAGRPKVLLTHNGKTQCLKDWALELGLNPATLTVRRKKGLPVEQILKEAP